jgi:hypothetical protein
MASEQERNNYDLLKKPFDTLLPAAKRVVAGRYLSGKMSSCKPFPYPGYEGLPTERCRYTQGKLIAEVVLLDPDAEQLTRWVLSICELSDLHQSVRFQSYCGRRLLTRIKQQSRGHFPVAGIVLEGGKGYAFRHGITAEVPGIENGVRRQYTDDELEAAISAPIIGWGKYAGLGGTTYEQYVSYGRLIEQPMDGNEKPKLVDDSAMTFPELIGMRYKEAWGRNYNSMLRAWTCANMEYIKSKMSCIRMPDGAKGAARNTP